MAWGGGVFTLHLYCIRHSVIPNWGTYICFYMNHTAEVAKWDWTDATSGTLHCWDPYDPDNSDWEGYTTVRFKGKQMRVYEDYSGSEDGFSFRMICVNTLTVGY